MVRLINLKRHLACTNTLQLNMLQLKIAGLAICSLFISPVQANGFGENTPWQFNTANDRIAKTSTADLIERKQGGYYDSFQVNNTYNTSNITDINGDQINCFQQAITTGNDGTQFADGASSSPTTGSQGDIGSSAVGNESYSDVSDSSRDSSNQYGLDSSTPSNSKLSDSKISNSTVDNPTQADQQASIRQDNLNSQQTSSVSDSNISSRVGSVDASGGRTSQALNSSQTNRDSHLQASITGSTGCSFVRPASTSASP